MQSTRANTVLFAALGAMIGVGLVVGASAFSPLAAVALLGAYLGGLAYLAVPRVRQQAASLRVVQPQAALASMRSTPKAREAATRARRRGEVGLPGITLIDVGMMSSARGDRNISYFRDQVSKEHDGARPFVKLYVSGAMVEHAARVRFLLRDPEGHTRFDRELDVTLREGEMDVLPTHHLSLAGQNEIAAGEWDTEIYLEGQLIGAHRFTIAPSMDERLGRAAATLSSEASDARLAPARRVIDAQDESGALSLEDLLRQAEPPPERRRTNGGQRGE